MTIEITLAVMTTFRNLVFALILVRKNRKGG